MMNNDILYTPDEIASFLKITKGTVYEMIKRGDINAHRIGRHLRISKTQFELYLLRSSGNANVFEGEIMSNDGESYVNCGPVIFFVESELEGHVKVSIRPENIILSTGNFTCSARNQLYGKITDIAIDGQKAVVTLDVGVLLKSCITVKSLKTLSISLGSELYAIFKTMSISVYK